MSDNNELSLLEDELGDDIEYDLGNEDEDALLADDFDIQSSSQRDVVYLNDDPVIEENQEDFQEYEEPLDDVLDLGVTDGLDDLESEIQETAEDNALSGKKKARITHDSSYLQQQNFSIQEVGDQNKDVNSALPQNTNFGVDIPTGDAHTRLESEEEDEGEAEEGRDRFKTERTNIVSLKSGKSYGNIPDSLDNVLPVDEGASQKQVHKREGGQWRGRRGRGTHRGGMRPHFHQGPVFGPGGPRGPGGFVRHPLHQQQQLQQQQQQLQPQQQHQQLPQSLQQQLPQPPHKILINPHFRGAVQPHPDARLIWDMDPGSQLPGDGLLPFPQKGFPEAPYGSTPQGSYEPAFHQQESIQNAYNNVQMPPQQQVEQFYQHDSYPEHQQQQPPEPEYWQSIQAPLQLGPHSNDVFYPQQQPPADAGLYNMPQYLDHSPVMPHEEHSFQHPGDQGHMQGAMQPGVWQSAAPDTLQLSPSQVMQHFSNTQVPRIFHLQSPAAGPRPGMRFRQSGPGSYRNFSPRRPRFPGRMIGPRGRRPSGGIPQLMPPQQHQQKNFRLPQKRLPFEGRSNVVPLTHIERIEPGPKRKKRMPDMNNLHEVQTVDTLPSQTVVEVENEDEETKEYRKKIEEQKRLRERVLQQKEARRKLAALEKQRELQKKDLDLKAAGDAPVYFHPHTDPPQGNAIATIVNRNTVEPQPTTQTRHIIQPVLHPPAERSFVPPRQQPMQGPVENVIVVPQSQVQHTRVRGRGRGVLRGRGRGMGRGGMNIQQQHLEKQQVQQQQQQQQQQMPPTQIAGPVSESVQVMRKKMMTPAVPAPGQRIVRAVQTAPPKRVIVSQARVMQTNPNRTVVLRGATGGKPPVPQQQQQQPQQQQQQQQRRVVQKAMPAQLVTQVRPASSAPVRKVVSTQTAGITVMSQPQEATALQPAPPRTTMVGVENLAASTTEAQLRRMCHRVGALEKIQMIPSQRRAVLTFVNPVAANLFFKRYQRKMVDLSLITVKLIIQ